MALLILLLKTYIRIEEKQCTAAISVSYLSLSLHRTADFQFRIGGKGDLLSVMFILVVKYWARQINGLL